MTTVNDADRVAVELPREQWRQIQVRLMQAETPEVPEERDADFEAIVEAIDEQLSE